MSVWDDVKDEGVTLFHDGMNLLVSAIASILAQEEVELPAVDSAVVDFVIGHVAPVFDVPAVVIDFIENGTIAKNLSSLKVARLTLLQARIEALASASVSKAGTVPAPAAQKAPDSVGAFPV
jgi:hypothetical protein